MPKENEWKKEQEKNPLDTQGLENPLPDALKVRLSKLEGADDMIRSIQKMPTVLEVDDDPHSRSAVLGFLNLLRWLGTVLGGLLFLTGGILIHNAIRMTIIVRRREIRIMQLVGAPQAIVCTPFLLEGIIQGLLGGAVATLLVSLANQVFLRFAEKSIDIGSRNASFPMWTVLLVLCGIGSAYGFLCSALAAREPLKLR
jgi:cell division transport system permease protein